MNFKDFHIIKTKRLDLICADLEIIEAALAGDTALAAMLEVKIPAVWTEHGEPAFRWTETALKRPGGQKQWFTYLPILREENTLIGTCGFKGTPANSMVEIGYEIARDYRGRGFATELSKGLIAFAFEHPEVNLVQAHTLAEINESGSVLKNCGMTKMETIEDPEDCKIWRWERIK